MWAEGDAWLVTKEFPFVNIPEWIDTITIKVCRQIGSGEKVKSRCEKNHIPAESWLPKENAWRFAQPRSRVCVNLKGGGSQVPLEL